MSGRKAMAAPTLRLAIRPRSLGIFAAVAAFALDQTSKLWLIFGYGIAARQPLRVTPFFEIVFAKNPGISYSLLSKGGAVGRWSLLIIAVGAIALLGFWLWRARTKFTALGLGLIIGGALGNACDRLIYGYVADFYHFHMGGFSWYVFNLADVAICVGVALLLSEPLLRPQEVRRERAHKLP